MPTGEHHRMMEGSGGGGDGVGKAEEKRGEEILFLGNREPRDVVGRALFLGKFDQIGGICNGRSFHQEVEVTLPSLLFSPF